MADLAALRRQAVEKHFKWVEAAKYLDCHSICVTAETRDVGTPEEQAERAADGLHQLAQFAARHGLNVLVENHGGLSSHGAWLAGVVRRVNLPNCGTLPDFGNFRIGKIEGIKEEVYDRYKGVDELMPFAKGVSAKSHDFNDKGEEIHTDYRKMLDIVVKKHKYNGYIGVEYEGSKLSEADGIRATQKLLQTIRAELAKG